MGDVVFFFSFLLRGTGVPRVNLGIARMLLSPPLERGELRRAVRSHQLIHVGFTERGAAAWRARPRRVSPSRLVLIASRHFFSFFLHFSPPLCEMEKKMKTQPLWLRSLTMQRKPSCAIVIPSPLLLPSVSAGEWRFTYSHAPRTFSRNDVVCAVTLCVSSGGRCPILLGFFFFFCPLGEKAGCKMCTRALHDT